jgi:hypothetical protein
MARRGQIAETVNRLFAAAGDVVRPATVTRSTPGAYDPANGGPGAPVVASTSASALYDHAARPRFGLVDGLTVAPNQENLWLAGCGFAPAPGDVITIDGTQRVIRAAHDLFEAGALHLVVAE